MSDEVVDDLLSKSEYIFKVPLSVGSRMYYFVYLIKTIHYPHDDYLSVSVLFTDNKGMYSKHYGIKLPYVEFIKTKNDYFFDLIFQKGVNKFYDKLKDDIVRFLIRNVHKESVPDFSNILTFRSAYSGINRQYPFIGARALFVDISFTDIYNMWKHFEEVKDPLSVNVKEHFKKVKSLRRGFSYLTKEEWKKALGFNLPLNFFNKKFWEVDYSKEIFKALLKEYKRKTGHYFLPYCAYDGMNDEVDKKVLFYISGILKTDSVALINTKTMDVYKEWGIESKAIQSINNSAVQYVKKSKGKVSGYKILWKVGKDTYVLIRTVPSDNIEEKDGKYRIKDCNLSASLGSMVLSHKKKVVERVSILTYDDVVKKEDSLGL